MGKVHRIKKAFERKLMLHEVEPGDYGIRYGTYAHVGKRQDGSRYMVVSSSRGYNGLLKQLEVVWEKRWGSS